MEDEKDLAFQLRTAIQNIDYSRVDSGISILLIYTLTGESICVFRSFEFIGMYFIPHCPDLIYESAGLNNGERKALVRHLESQERRREELTSRMNHESHSIIAKVRRNLDICTVEELYKAGTFLDVLDRGPEALECYEALLERNGDHAGALFHAGALYFAMGNYDSAFDFIGRALPLRLCVEQRIDALNYLALIYQKRGEADKAEACLLRGLEERDESAVCLNSLASLYMRKGNHNAAYNYYKRTIKAVTIESVKMDVLRDAVYNIATLLICKKNKPSEALSILTNHAEYDPLIFASNRKFSKLFERAYNLSTATVKADAAYKELNIFWEGEKGKSLKEKLTRFLKRHFIG